MMAPMFPFVPTAPQGVPLGSNETSAWPHSQANSEVAAFHNPESTILSERSDNLLPTAMFTPVNTHEENMSNKQVAGKAEDIMFVSENTNISMCDDRDAASETEVEDEGIISAAQKRKRRTNNSLNHYLDAGVADLDIRPPKRLYPFSFEGARISSPNLPYDDDGLSDTDRPTTSPALKFTPLERDKGALIGIWKDSPVRDPDKTHAVWGFLDAVGHIRRKIMTETRDGERIEQGNPTGTGKGFVSPEGVILEPHLSTLTNPQLKEYIRIRCESRRQNELPEERKKSEALAAMRAKTAIASNAPTPSTPAPARCLSSTPTAAARPQTSPKPPKGFLVGCWKFSDALDDADKHAVYAVVDGPLDGPSSGGRLRVKLSQQTKDRRHYRGNYPENPGSGWLPYESVILAPPLANLNRFELTEYVRIRHIETLEGKTELGNWIVDLDAIEKAKANIAVDAKVAGYDPAARNAEWEAKRIAQYNAKIAKAKENRAPARRSQNQSPKVVPPTAPIHTPRAAGRENNGEVLRDDAVSEDPGNIALKEEIPSSLMNHMTYATNAEASTPPFREDKVDKPSEKPMAKRSNKADARARHEKVMKKLDPDNKSKDPAPGDRHLSGHAPEKTAMPSRRTHNLNETVGLPSVSRNEPHRSVEGAARKGIVSQDLPRERANAREVVNDEGKSNGKHRQEKDSRARDKSDVEMRADARLGNKKAEEQRKAGEKRKATEMMDADEQRVEEQNRLAQQKVRAEGQKKRFEEQRKTGEQKRSEERLKADGRQKIQEKQSEQANAGAESEVQERARLSEKERPERLQASKPVPEIPLAGPPRGDAAQGNSAPSEAITTSTDVKWHNDMKYSRRSGGPLDGKLVAEKRQLITINGEDFVEFRVLIQMDY